MCQRPKYNYMLRRFHFGCHKEPRGFHKAGGCLFYKLNVFVVFLVVLALSAAYVMGRQPL